MAALMSPPVAMRACRLASRLMKPMALSWSSWDWNRTSGVWVYKGKDNNGTLNDSLFNYEAFNVCNASVNMCTDALPPPPPANIWSICCISCCWALFAPALLGEEAGFSVGMLGTPAVGIPGTPAVGIPGTPAVGIPGTPAVGILGTPAVGIPGTPPDIKLIRKEPVSYPKYPIKMTKGHKPSNLGIRPGASVCSVCSPCWICIRACMALGLVITDKASGFCICREKSKGCSKCTSKQSNSTCKPVK